MGNGGVSTGGTFAPVLDAQKRPITAGGFVDHGPVIFIDVTAKAGLSKWTHRDGTSPAANANSPAVARAREEGRCNPAVAAEIDGSQEAA